jgi:hypothetical protein
MLVLQVIVHLILILPFCVTYTMNSWKLFTHTVTVKAICFVFVIWQQCANFFSFFLCLFSGNIYQQQLNRILKSIKCHHTSAQSIVRKKKDIYQELPLIVTIVQKANGMINKCRLDLN